MKAEDAELRIPGDKPCSCSGDCDRYILALEEDLMTARESLASIATTGKSEWAAAVSGEVVGNILAWKATHAIVLLGKQRASRGSTDRTKPAGH